MRNELLELHRAVLEAEKQRYERTHGRIASAGEALQIVINDPQFAWIQPLSELIVALDRVEEMLESPRYRELLQEVPDVVLAHRRVSQLVTSWKRPS
jgi:hypothetical protein